jgi:hypothetical protein
MSDGRGNHACRTERQTTVSRRDLAADCRREAAPAYGIDVASRVAALENVLRRNGAVDPEESSAAIHDIIRASVVHAGQQQDAAHALAQLTQLLAMGGPVSGGGDTQGALLLNVLQHVRD